VHVGLNLAFLTPGEMGGLEVYSRELARALAARDDVRLTLFLGRPAAGERSWAELGATVGLPVDPRRRAEWVRGDQHAVPRAAARAGVDLLHSLASTAPLHGRFVRVTTIHDLNYKLVPDSHFGLRGLGMRVLVPAAARRSHRVIADSDSTRDDLVRHLGTPRAKIDVAPLGVSPRVGVPPTPTPELRRRLDLDERPLVLSVSAKRPHKNLARLLRALAAIEAARRPSLVVPGYPTPHERELHELVGALGLADRVRLPGWLAAEDLEGLYAAATCFVFPSLYEGFGLPVLEAMARGVPVACSDRASLPEVAGDAALLFDPERVEAIGAAVERLVSDTTLREQLRGAGLRRAAGFSWGRTAELTVASYRRALGLPV
jgi:glycosyltransferase involved in cell wall biosynthesis